MSIDCQDDDPLRVRIREQLAAARTRVALLQPEDRELRGRLRQQLDEMLAELLAPTFRGPADPLQRPATAPAAQPVLSLKVAKIA
jgi:hypothetical protein